MKGSGRDVIVDKYDEDKEILKAAAFNMEYSMMVE